MVVLFFGHFYGIMVTERGSGFGRSLWHISHIICQMFPAENQKASPDAAASAGYFSDLF